MCPACYVPFLWAFSVWLLSFFGLEDSHTAIDTVSWVISILVSVAVYYGIRWYYKRKKKK